MWWRGGAGSAVAVLTFGCVMTVSLFFVPNQSSDINAKDIVKKLDELYRSESSFGEKEGHKTVIRYLKLFYNVNAWLSLNAAYDFSPRIQDPLLFENQPILISLDPFKYRALNFDARICPTQNKNVASFGIFHNLDHTLITVKTVEYNIAQIF